MSTDIKTIKGSCHYHPLKVTFQIAKLLKEKGFNERPLHIKLNTDYVEGYSYDTEDTEDYLKETEFQFEDNVCSHLYLRPTIAEVVMWLYEKHGIWITVGVDSLFYKGKHHVLIYKNHGNGLELSSIENTLHGPYNSPKEAYENAIKYCLEKII